MFSIGWVPCTDGTGIIHVQVLQQTLQVKPMATVFLFWTVRRSQTDGAYVGDLKHGIGPFLCHNIHPTPLEPMESRGQVLRIMSFPSLICQTVYAGFGMQSSQSLNESSFSFGSLLLHVVTGHVLDSDRAKALTRRMSRE
ncbi:hypothetical protein TNCV_763251 [Trichonephila clavipes]|nr:hypothetical protein TNCV_763251 [Trichonephila clavipes]